MGRTGKQKIQIPAYIFIEMFNSIPKLNEVLRSDILEYLRTYKQVVQSKGRVVEGLVLNDLGLMDFDGALYDEAVYRGKVDTYYESTKEAFEKIMSPATLLKTMMTKQDEFSKKLTNETAARKICSRKPLNASALELMGKLIPLLETDQE